MLSLIDTRVKDKNCVTNNEIVGDIGFLRPVDSPIISIEIECFCFVCGYGGTNKSHVLSSISAQALALEYILRKIVTELHGKHVV